jgi:hypothetical protein
MRRRRSPLSRSTRSRLKGIGHNLDGGATTKDLGIGFSYNPASQVVARLQTNATYDYLISAVNRVYTSNGLNQCTQVAGTGGATLTWDTNGNRTSDGSTTFAESTACRAAIPRDAGPGFHGMPGHRSTAGRAG